MSDNTLTHPTNPTVQNLPTAVKLALSNYKTTTNALAGDDYEYWQGHADAASVCVHELDCAAETAFAERNFDLVEQIQELSDHYAQRSRDCEDRASDIYFDELAQTRPQPPVTFEYFVTAQGRRLLNLLSHDPSRIAAAGIIAFVGQTELNNTLADLHACQQGRYDQIRPVTLKRGLIVGAPVPAMRTARTTHPQNAIPHKITGVAVCKTNTPESITGAQGCLAGGCA